MTTTEHPTPRLTRPALKTPRAAAIAGIIFAVLFATSTVLARVALPPELEGGAEVVSLEINSRTVSFALTLVPFAGIAFLWFMGVVRDRLGARQDQLFSTVFTGSGMLFLAMVFVAAGVAGGILLSLENDSTRLVQSGTYDFGRAVMNVIMNVYAVRMAGVFMFSLGTLGMRTGALPRLGVWITYALALLVLLALTFSWWLILVFPAWVFGVSVYILIESGRGRRAETGEVLGEPAA